MTARTLNADRIGGLLILAFSSVYGVLAFDIPILASQADGFTAATMPKFIAACGVVLSVTLLVRPGSARTSIASSTTLAPGSDPTAHWGRFGAFLVLMSVYGLLLKPLGFLISTSAFLLTGFLLLGERRPLVLLGVALPVAAGFWMLMSLVLGVHLAAWPDPSRWAG